MKNGLRQAQAPQMKNEEWPSTGSGTANEE